MPQEEEKNNKAFLGLEDCAKIERFSFKTVDSRVTP